MANRKNFLFLGVLTFILFFVLSILVSSRVLTSFDFNTTVRIQDNLPDSIITLFSVFSILGSVEITGLFLLGSILLFSPLRKIVVIIAFGLTGVIEIAGKLLIEQTGPPIAFLKTNLGLNFPSDHIPHEFFAYPSGHSARTAFISALIIVTVLIFRKISMKSKKIIIALVLFFDFLMYLSRVYLGEHWVTDVIGGMLLGTSLAMLSSYFIVKRTIT